mgnify:FL=1
MSKTTRKRARTTSGQFKADDPSTPNVNEAWVEGPKYLRIGNEITERLSSYTEGLQRKISETSR